MDALIDFQLMLSSALDFHSAPLTTLTLFTYCSTTSRLWALKQMGTARKALSRASGLRFWKLLGCGEGGGFSLRPDWSRYGLLAVWETADSADAFFNRASLMTAYRDRANEIWTVRLRALQSHGAWSGVNPFLPIVPAANQAAPVAVLTRATINWNRLPHFWRAVPAASSALYGAPGLLASIGIGEAPFVRQATFSLWRSGKEMEIFAYKTAAHKDVIRRTRQEKWYREELFTRFEPLATEGSWNGADPLKDLL